MLHNRKLYMLIAVFLITAFIGALAQVPEKPKTPLNFSASIKTEKASNAVEFKWDKNTEGTAPNIYFVYYAKKYTNDLNDFKQLYAMNASEKTSYSFIKLLESGEYTFYIVAALKSGGQILYSDPSEFVQLKVEKTNSENYIKFISSPPDGGKIELNKAWTYQLKIQTNLQGTIKYAFVGDVPEGMTIDETTGLISWTPTKEGKYAITVKAYMESDPTKFAKHSFYLIVGSGGEKETYIKITSKVPNEGKILVNTPWTYDIEYSTNLTGDIKFAFVGEVPEGMTMDESTGIISWTPGTEGKYVITVKVYSVDDPTKYTKYQFFLFVYTEHVDKKACATFSGTVYYEDGTPVDEGNVKAWLVDGKKEAPKFTGKIGTDGKYTINVPEGTYFLQVEGGNFYKEYFENTSDVKSAARFEIVCDDAKTVDFTVTKKAVPKKYTVSGTVTSEADGTPLYALVEFRIVGVLNGTEKPGEKIVSTVKTDKDGNYSIELYDSYVYIARAYSLAKDPFFYPEYYDNASTSLEAKQITLTDNLTGVNFSLKSVADADKGSLSGKVTDKDGNGIKASVIAYLTGSEKYSDKKYIYKVTAETDDEGNFILENMVYGEYIIISVPKEKAYMPGYYIENDFAQKNWKEATRVVIDKADNGSITIKHSSRTGEKGLAHLRGNISQRDGMFGKNVNSPNSSNVISETFIYVTDNSGEVIDFGFSNAQGEFYLSELMTGTLYVTADRVGYEEETATIETDYSSNSIVYKDLTLAPEEVAVVEEVTLTSLGLAVYPNPAADFINISNPNNYKIYGINLMSVDGSVTNSINTESGNQNYNIRVSTNAAGMYILRIMTEKGTIIQPVMIVR